MCAAFMSYEPVQMLYRPAGNFDVWDGGAAGGFVGVAAGAREVRGLHVGRAGADAVQPGRELRRIGRGVGGAAVRQRLDPEPGDLAVLVGGELGLDPVVAREAIGLEVLAAILDPLDRPAEHEAGDRAA